MFFSNPIWLAGLIPWAALAAWLLLGRRPEMSVPFIGLWRDERVKPQAAMALRLPPFGVIAALAAIAAAIMGAAGPRRGKAVGEPVAIIVDRGLTMSAGRQRERFKDLAAQAGEALKARLGPDVPVMLLPVPGNIEQSTSEAWTKAVMAMPRTAVGTGSELRAAVREALRSEPAPAALIVIGDQVLDDDRAIEVRPEAGLDDLAITAMGVGEGPGGQLMVSVRNLSGLRTAKLVVRTGAQELSRAIELPAAGEQRNYFVDIAGIGAAVEADLEVGDDVEADDRMWLTRERQWPRVEARTQLPQEVERMVEVFSKERRAPEGTPIVAIVADTTALGSAAGVVLASARSVSSGEVAGSAEVLSHAVTDGLDWKVLANGTRTFGQPPQGWRTVLSVGGAPLVAVREASAGVGRAVWVGFESAEFSRRPDFVVFWAKAFEWVGEGGEESAGHPLRQMGEQWELITPPRSGRPVERGLWPGLYRNGAGEIRAMNVTELTQPPPGSSDWRVKLGRLKVQRTGGKDLRPMMLLLALGLLVLAAAMWPTGRRR